MEITQVPAEPRLQRRYHALVVAQLAHSQRVAAGLHLPAALADPFAATQAAWRFYNNPRLTLEQLAQPLRAAAQAEAPRRCRQWVLVAMDWSNLHLTAHPRKRDRVALAQGKDLGYELLTALAISDRNGEPLAPLCLELRAADGVHSTRSPALLPRASALDSLLPIMAQVQTLELGQRPVFIIDREADSVGHYRQWQARNLLFLVRADEQPRVLYDCQEQPLGQVADELKQGKGFRRMGPVEFQGKTATQYVAETWVVLERPARSQRVDPASGKAVHRQLAGVPLPLRLIVSEVRDQHGKVLARWLLLSNLPEAVSAAQIALWYYWRWRIESYHKLLKGAGQQVECWQQETAGAFSRRLVVTAMAAVVVWRLARDESREGAQMREVLVRLSGRQMKRGKEARGFTEPALLAGLGVLIPMLDLLSQYRLQDLRELTQAVLPAQLTAACAPPTSPPAPPSG
jgi:hypothetical protein